jgi:hypothetical protein
LPRRFRLLRLERIAALPPVIELAINRPAPLTSCAAGHCAIADRSNASEVLKSALTMAAQSQPEPPAY